MDETERDALLDAGIPFLAFYDAQDRPLGNAPRELIRRWGERRYGLERWKGESDDRYEARLIGTLRHDGRERQARRVRELPPHGSRAWYEHMAREGRDFHVDRP